MEHEGLNQGHRYCDLYVAPKYDNLKEELMNNRILTLSPEAFNLSQQKAETLSERKQAKKIKARTGSEQTEYGIKYRSPITMKHLLAVVLYTDFTKLSYLFSATFRRKNARETLKEQMARNAEYGHWSRLLRETVELFGTDMSETKIEIFYHGVGKLIFSSFVSYFGSPTSTTAQLEVATVFADKSGLILELQRAKRALCYFNCSWLSAFGNEDERILCGGQFPMHFGSIRDMSTDCDYRQFIHALTSFDYALSGHATLGGGHEYNKLDRSIIRALIKECIKNDEDNNGNANNSVIPEYINQTFLAFCKARKFVNIIKPRLDRKGIMEKLLFQKDNDRMIRFELFFVFKELESITVEYDSFFRPRVDTKTLDMIREGLVTVNERIHGMEKGMQEESPQVEMTQESEVGGGCLEKECTEV